MSDQVKAFWCDKTEKVLLRVQDRPTQEFKQVAIFENESAARPVCEKLWAEGTISTSCYIPIYRAPDGSEFDLSAAPAGAMWDAPWIRECWPEEKGDDDLTVIIRLPNGRDWNIDSQASNCTRKEDKAHRCWCRHGDVRKGEIHVDKNGNTCGAGAGSIQAGDYHGFLHNSHLVRC